MAIAIRTFDPAAATDEDWERFYAYVCARFDEAGLPGRPPTLARWKDWLRAPAPHGERRHWIAEDGDRVVSSLGLNRYRSDPVRIEGNGGVLRPHRRRGIGTGWLRKALAWMAEVAGDRLQCVTSDEDGRAFLEHFGFGRVRALRASRLDLRAADPALLDTWIGGLPPGVVLEVHESPHDDARLAEYTALANAIHRTVPGIEDFDAVGDRTPEETRARLAQSTGADGIHHLVVAREPDGTASGLTDVGWRPDRPEGAHQMLTGVLPECQGRGIGKALKATMVRHLLARHEEIEHLTTSNATTNAAMLSINERLGFSRFLTQTIYRIDRERLAAGLAPSREEPR